MFILPQVKPGSLSERKQIVATFLSFLVFVSFFYNVSLDIEGTSGLLISSVDAFFLIIATYLLFNTNKLVHETSVRMLLVALAIVVAHSAVVAPSLSLESIPSLILDTFKLIVAMSYFVVFYVFMREGFHKYIGFYPLTAAAFFGLVIPSDSVGITAISASALYLMALFYLLKQTTLVKLAIFISVGCIIVFSMFLWGIRLLQLPVLTAMAASMYSIPSVRPLVRKIGVSVIVAGGLAVALSFSDLPRLFTGAGEVGGMAQMDLQELVEIDLDALSHPVILTEANKHWLVKVRHDGGIWTRLILWELTLQAIRDSFPLGIGLGQIDRHIVPYLSKAAWYNTSSHNTILLALSELGLVGAVFIVAVGAWIIYGLRYLSWPLRISLVVFFAVALLIHDALTVRILYVLWALFLVEITRHAEFGAFWKPKAAWAWSRLRPLVRRSPW